MCRRCISVSANRSHLEPEKIAAHVSSYFALLAYNPYAVPQQKLRRAVDAVRPATLREQGKECNVVHFSLAHHGAEQPAADCLDDRL